MFPSEQLYDLREAALRKRHGLNPAHPASIPDAVSQLVEDLTILYVSGDIRLSTYVDVNSFEVKGLDFEPLILLASNPNSSMAYALLEKKLHDTFLPQVKAQIDTTMVRLRRFRAKLLYDNVTCRFIIDLDVIDSY